MYFSLTFDWDTFAPSGDIASLIPARGTDIKKRDHEMGCQTKNGRPAETLESDVTQRSRPRGAGAPSAASLRGRQTQLTS